MRAVSFTGGLKGGQAISAACARDFKSVQLELGGNNAMIVLEDADLEATVSGIVAGMTTLNGQWCRALGRLLLPASRAEEFMDAALEGLKHVQIGNSMSEDSAMGPLANQAHFKRVSESVEKLTDQGGQAHTASALPNLAGNFIAPTLISGAAPAATLEEIFGPVAAIHAYEDVNQAVQLANQTPYGLGGYVYGANEHAALDVARQMRTGGVKVNGVSLLELNVDAPRPAWGLSGFGEEGTLETFNVFCGSRVVGVAGRSE